MSCGIKPQQKLTATNERWHDMALSYNDAQMGDVNQSGYLFA